MTANYESSAYPLCDWKQAIYGPGDRCLLVGMVDVNLSAGGVAKLCFVHAERFAKHPELGIARNRDGRPIQIEAE